MTRIVRLHLEIEGDNRVVNGYSKLDKRDAVGLLCVLEKIEFMCHYKVNRRNQVLTYVRMGE